ncbi:MAG: phospholipase D-like domain-containing protein [Aggregatilineales bacterium]
MKIPYVIDNQQHKLADVLNTLLTGDSPVQHIDVATAYFNPWGYRLLRDGLQALRGFRLLLPKAGDILDAGRNRGFELTNKVDRLCWVA